MSDIETLRTSDSKSPRRNARDAARVEWRNAVQWLARIAQSFSAESDETVRLLFDPDARRLETPDLGRNIRLGLSLPGLVLQFFEDGAPTPHALDPDDKSSTEVEAWLLAELLHRGFARRAFRKELPYDWDDQMSGDEVKYSPHHLAEALDRLTQDLVEAAVCLKEVTASSGLSYLPSRDALAATLPRGTGAVEVAYEMGETVQRYRVLQRASGEDILIATDGERCPVAQIRDAVEHLRNA